MEDDMPQIDLGPLMRSTIGFDTLDRLFDAAFREAGRDSSYPPYDIVKLGDNRYRITMAVAGFSEDDLEIVVENGVLNVRGKPQKVDEGATFLHRGIARRAFEHRFQLADQVRVTGASLNNGLLDIELERVVPEAAKPKRIEIRTGR
jgi:molecular chaperone IbpA